MKNIKFLAISFFIALVIPTFASASTVSGFQQKYKDAILALSGLKYSPIFISGNRRIKLNAPVTCALSVSPSPIRYCDGQLIFTYSSSPTTGYRTKWYGTKNGVVDENGTDYGWVTNGSSPNVGPWPGHPEVIGNFTRYFKGYDTAGTEVCISNTVNLSITDCALPDGFWDEGLVQGTVRSDFGDINPITFGTCLYPPGPSACPAPLHCNGCPTGPSSYSASNAYSNVQPAPSDSFWVLGYNNEPAFDNTHNSGPPNQSLPVNPIGSGVFQFGMDAVGNSKRVRMVLDNSSNPWGAGGIPYMSFGVQKNRGNLGKNISYFTRGDSSDNTIVNFTAALESCTGQNPVPCFLDLQIHSRWNNKFRMVQLMLAHINSSGEVGGTHGHWNWPVAESFYFNGFDIAWLNCEDMGISCMNVGDQKTYSISLKNILLAASDKGLFDDPIPSGVEIPIEGVHWAIETAYSQARMAVSLQDIRSAASIPSNCYPLTFNSANSRISPSSVALGGSYTISCDYGTVVDCIFPSVPSGTCSWTGFTGTAANFSCIAGSGSGTFNSYCATFSTTKNCCPYTNSIGTLTVNP